MAVQGELLCSLKSEIVDGMPLICAKGRCSKQSKYGVSGSRRGEYCAEHALEGMVYVYSNKCVGDGCPKRPSYGVSGSKKPEYCAEHALEGMVDVLSLIHI